MDTSVSNGVTISMTTPDFRIEQATIEDVPLILSFIKDLAEYEKLLHEIVVTEDILRKNLFGENPVARALLAYYRGAPAGFAIYFYNFSTFLGRPGIYLEDLFVKPAYRGRGIGKAFLIYLARLARDNDCGRFEWAVLDWNQSAIDFYVSLGVTLKKEWIVNQLTGQTLTNLANQEITIK